MFGIGDSVVVGYDLSNEYAQISYCTGKPDSIKTVSLSPGEEQYNIPVCLFKRGEVNQWFVGKDAITYSEIEEGEMVKQLWDRALIGEPVTVADEEFDPLSLLALYVRRSLVILYNEVKKEHIKGIMFTVPELTKRAIEILNVISASIDIKDIPIGFMGREESIFYYVVMQPKELWNHDVMVFDYNASRMPVYTFRLNRNTKPLVAFVDKQVYEINELSDEDKDARFTDIIKESTDGRIVSLAYLLGDGFNGEWTKESIRELCRNRRAFKGNNLYSRGACYGMYEKLSSKLENRNIIFLGADKLKANIGMNVMRGNTQSYLALLDGGENWFDSKKTVDLILDTGNDFVLTITPLDGRNVRQVEIVLDGLGEHEPKAVRIRLEVVMESESIVRVNVTDMGFGEFKPASNQLFTKQITLND